MIFTSYGRHGLLAALGAVTSLAIGCARDDGDIEARVEALGMERQTTYADVIPAANQTLIGPRETLAIARAAEGQTPIAGEARTLVDATDERVFFPMPRAVREFEDRSDILQFMLDSFGADEVERDADGNLLNVSGSYAMHGRAMFRDGQTGLRYRVTDPLLAYVAGARGVVRIGGEEVCYDPDEDCDGEYASYMAPEATLTLLPPTHAPVNGVNGVIMTFHSFFNRSSVWSRHGSNIGLNFAALPSTTLRTQGYVTGLQTIDYYKFPLPLESNVGQNFVESAHWVHCACGPIGEARAVCGAGRGFDVDVGNPFRMTSNGPDTLARNNCTEWLE